MVHIADRKRENVNILLIQILRLGDAIQLTATIRAIKLAFPKGKISVLTSSLGKRIFEQMEEVDQVFVLRKQGIKAVMAAGKDSSLEDAYGILEQDVLPLTSVNWDWVINLSFSFPSALLAFISKGQRYSGFHANRQREYVSGDKWFSYCLSAFPNRKYSLFNWIDINRHIVGVQGRPMAPIYRICDTEKKWAEKEIGSFQKKYRDVIAFHPGASGPHKQWPIENFCDLASRLVRRFNYGIVVIGDASEKNLGNQLQASLPDNVMNMAGRTSIGETAALLSLCSRLLCNDSGPMHLAAAVRTPVVSLFFSTHYVETGPYGEGHSVLHPDIECFPCLGTTTCEEKQCLDSIPVDAVEAVFEKLEISQDRLEDASGGLASTCSLVSRFDPWGFLEWLPMNQTSLKPVVVVKVVLKIAVIESFAGIHMDYEDKQKYVMEILNSYSFPQNDEDILVSLKGLMRDVNEIASLLAKTCNLCVEIGQCYFEGSPSSRKMQELSEKMGKLEDRLTNYKDSPMSLITQTIGMQRDNITDRDYLRLTNQSIGLYRESIQLVDAVRSSCALVSDLVQKSNVGLASKRVGEKAAAGAPL